MPNRDSSQSEDGRHRRLDDLFGDEPYLSPTMRARRLLAETPEPEDLPATPPRKTTSREPAQHVSPRGPADSWKDAAASVDASRGASPDEESAEDDPQFQPTPRMLKLVKSLTAKGLLTPGSSPPSRPSKSGTVSKPALTMVAGADRDGSKRTAVPLAEAAAFLRSECPASATPPEFEPLEWLRSEVLPRWLKQVPARNTDHSIEE